jgi:hypothetical protein
MQKPKKGDKMNESETTVGCRVPYVRHRTYLDQSHALIVRKRGGGERRIESGRWWINKYTPVGEDAEIWERMPHEGRRLIDDQKIIATESAPTTPSTSTSH